MEGELRISKGRVYSKWWERLQRSYEKRNMYREQIRVVLFYSVDLRICNYPDYLLFVLAFSVFTSLFFCVFNHHL